MADDKKARKTKAPTAQKRDTQNAKRRLRNRSFKSKVKTAIRAFEKEIAQGDREHATSHLRAIYSLLDKGVKMGIYKLNKAGRDKSRLSGRLP